MLRRNWKLENIYGNGRTGLVLELSHDQAPRYVASHVENGWTISHVEDGLIEVVIDTGPIKKRRFTRLAASQRRTQGGTHHA